MADRAVKMETEVLEGLHFAVQLNMRTDFTNMPPVLLTMAASTKETHSKVIYSPEWR